MTTMLERVTKAIGIAGDDLTDSGAAISKHEALTVLARAAIEAMRDPTPGMIEAAETHRFNIEQTVAQFYRVMIDRALSDGQAE